MKIAKLKPYDYEICGAKLKLEVAKRARAKEFLDYCNGLEDNKEIHIYESPVYWSKRVDNRNVAFELDTAFFQSNDIFISCKHRGVEYETIVHLDNIDNLSNQSKVERLVISLQKAINALAKRLVEDSKKGIVKDMEETYIYDWNLEKIV